MLKAESEGPRIPRPQGQSNTYLVVTLLSDEQASAQVSSCTQTRLRRHFKAADSLPVAWAGPSFRGSGLCPPPPKALTLEGNGSTLLPEPPHISVSPDPTHILLPYLALSDLVSHLPMAPSPTGTQGDWAKTRVRSLSAPPPPGPCGPASHPSHHLVTISPDHDQGASSTLRLGF